MAVTDIDFFDGIDSDPDAWAEAWGYQDERECKHCGKGGLFWEDTDEGWRLVDGRGEMHRCDPQRLHRVVLNNFEDLDAAPAKS